MSRVGRCSGNVSKAAAWIEPHCGDKERGCSSQTHVILDSVPYEQFEISASRILFYLARRVDVSTLQAGSVAPQHKHPVRVSFRDQCVGLVIY